MLGIYLFAKTYSKSIYVDIARLQWTRKQRIKNGENINARRAVVGFDAVDEKKDGETAGIEAGEGVVKERSRMRMISRGAFGLLMLWVAGSWVAYFWGVATGNNK